MRSKTQPSECRSLHCLRAPHRAWTVRHNRRLEKADFDCISLRDCPKIGISGRGSAFELDRGTGAR